MHENIKSFMYVIGEKIKSFHVESVRNFQTRC